MGLYLSRLMTPPNLFGRLEASAVFAPPVASGYSLGHRKTKDSVTGYVVNRGGIL